MHLSRGFDGLTVIEQALGLNTTRTGRTGRTGLTGSAAGCARVQACLPPHVPAPVPGPCKGWRHTIKTIKPRRRATTKVGASLFSVSGPLTPEQKAEIAKVYGGTFGTLTTKATEVTRDKKGIRRRLKIAGMVYSPGQDPNDRTELGVGDWTVELYEQDGQRWALLDYLSLDEQYQGQRLASGWLAQQMAWYREHDVAGVLLQADIDVGGIAWARQGWDFAEPRDAIAVEERILATLKDMADGVRHMGGADEDNFPRQWWKIPPAKRQEQARLAIEMRRRMISAKFGDDDFPTPYEISELGRWPGARFAGDKPGDDGDWWIGRAIMTGSDWMGVTLP